MDTRSISLPFGTVKTTVCDTDEFATAAAPHGALRKSVSWMGGLSYADAVNAARTGYQQGVAESDAFLNKFEDIDFASRRWKTIDAVAGGAPNIGAYLAGSPLAMRRRQRQLSEGAPLTIFCDLMSSAGVEQKHLKKRGAAVLALARMLGTARPVSVYAVGGTAYKGGNVFWAIRQSNPLDLSRSAFFLSHPAAARGLLYATMTNGGSTHWPWADHNKYRERACAIFAAATNSAIEDCLYLAPPYLTDDAIANPERFIRNMLATYGGAPTDTHA